MKRRDIEIADPLVVGQLIKLSVGFVTWQHATGVLSRMEDTETGVIVHVTGDDGSVLSAHINRKSIKDGRVQEGVNLTGSDYHIRILKEIPYRQQRLPMLAAEPRQ